MFSYEEGRTVILEYVKPLEMELLPLRESRGFALAEAIRTPHPMPLFTNSAVDGYAVRSLDLEQCSKGTPVRLKKLGYLYAGNRKRYELLPGSCVQIATGAPIPENADAVVMKEDISIQEQDVEFYGKVRLNQNMRFIGEDLPQGREMLPAGMEIHAVQLAFLATFGFSEVPVHRRPLVNIVSTGSELVDVEVEPQEGEIRESNRYMLEGMVAEAGCEVGRVVLVPDDPRQLKHEFESALKADVLLITGGMSVGEHDFVKPLLKELGVEEIFWKVSIKPGKPLFFGRRGKTLVFGLPGNPASSYVIFLEFTLPALRRMRGCRLIEKDWVEARLTDGVTGGISRPQLMRAQLSNHEGQYQVRPLNFQGSHSIGSLVEANALIWIDSDSPALPSGTRVRVRPLDNEIMMESN